MSRRLAITAVAFVALSLCAAAFASELTGLWVDVPFVPQQKDGCGAASIAMVMQYWEQHQGQPVRLEADPALILRALYSGPAHGIYASAMVRYFQQNGYRAFAFAGGQADLLSQLQQGRPLIAALKKPGSGPSLHYVVVVGLDEPRKLVLVNDPAQRKLLKVDQSQFEREWKAAGNWILLAVPEASSPGASNY